MPHTQGLFINAFCRQIKWWTLSCTWLCSLMLTMKDTKKKRVISCKQILDERKHLAQTVRMYRHICRRYILHTEHNIPFSNWLLPGESVHRVSLCSRLMVSRMITYPPSLNFSKKNILKTWRTKNTDSPGNKATPCNRQKLEFGLFFFFFAYAPLTLWQLLL